MLMCLDPGHQSAPNADTGCSGFEITEQDIVLDICKRAKPLIESNGVKVIMTRDGDTVNGDGSSLNASLNTRCEIANNAGADLFLSVHADAFNSQAYGTTVHVFGLGGKAEKFAKILNPQMGQLFYNRGIKVSNFEVIRDTNMAACLLETAFLDNQSDNAKLADPNIRQQIAVIIAKSVCIYFGIVYKEQITSQPSPIIQPSRGETTPIAIPLTSSGFTYPNNAKIINDDLYIRDVNGNKIAGRYVSNGDNVTIIEIIYDKQLLLVEYPTSNGIKNGYVRNVPSCIQYTYLNQWENGSTPELTYNDNNIAFGSLDPYETATPLYRNKNGFLKLMYNTPKGQKAGYVHWSDGFSKF